MRFVKMDTHIPTSTGLNSLTPLDPIRLFFVLSRFSAEFLIALRAIRNALNPIISNTAPRSNRHKSRIFSPLFSNNRRTNTKVRRTSPPSRSVHCTEPRPPRPGLTSSVSRSDAPVPIFSFPLSSFSSARMANREPLRAEFPVIPSPSSPCEFLIGNFHGFPYSRRIGKPRFTIFSFPFSLFDSLPCLRLLLLARHHRKMLGWFAQDERP
jgi:hypothetical protein